MATRTKTNRAPQAEWPRPTAAESIDAMIRGFLLRAEGIRAQYDQMAQGFVKAAAEDPIAAIQWRTEHLAELQATRRQWEHAVAAFVAFRDHDGDPRAAMLGVADMATDAILDMAKSRPWQGGWTNPFTNAIRLYEASGSARAWAEIRGTALAIVRAIDEAEAGGDQPQPEGSDR